jgi:5-methylcytosine-specific restriction endonuclease McrA
MESSRSCTLCHAGLGLGVKTSARLMRKNHSSLAAFRRSRGVITSEMGQKCRRMATELARARMEYEAASLASIAEHAGTHWHNHPEVYRHRARRASKIKYDALNVEQRRDYNAKVINRRSRTAPGYTQYRETFNKWRRQKGDMDKAWRVAQNLRSRLSSCLRGKSTMSKPSAISLLGCTVGGLRRHLERQFDSGMTWANYGTHWHVDHIIPVSSFDHNDPAQVAECWHYANLQPLTARANLTKGARLPANLPTPG